MRTRNHPAAAGVRRKKPMMTQHPNVPDDEILPEYSLKNAVRSKYADQYSRDAVVVLLDPDVAEIFPDDESVNRALRALAQIIREQASKTAA
jgi:hypothetical protein